MTSKFKWLIGAASFTVFLVSLYTWIHVSAQNAGNGGKEQVRLTEIQLTAVNSIIVSASEPVKSTDSLAASSGATYCPDTCKLQLKAYLKDMLDLYNPKQLDAMIDMHTLNQLQVILPNYLFEVNSYFWMTDQWALLEVIFWSLFGLMAHLLYSVTRSPVFREEEIPEHIGKVFYTPFMAIIVYLSCNGLVNSGSISLEGLGKNTIVFAFILGFFTRIAVDLINRVKDVVFPKSKEDTTTPATTTGDTSDPTNNAEDPTTSTVTQEQAQQAITEQEASLKATYPTLESLDAAVLSDNSIGVLAHVNGDAPSGFPTSISTQVNGASVSIPVEVVPVEEAEAHYGIANRIRNQNYSLETGSIGAVLVDKTNTNKRFLLTCAHVTNGGKKDDHGGYYNNSDVIEILEDGYEATTGKTVYSMLNGKIDTALVAIDASDDFDNELPDGHRLKNAVSMSAIKLKQRIKFYSSLEEKLMDGRVQTILSSQKFKLNYTNGQVTFSDLILLVGPSSLSPISQKGDSGSVVFTENYEPFAMIIGGTQKFTLAIPLQPILTSTNTKIYN